MDEKQLSWFDIAEPKKDDSDIDITEFISILGRGRKNALKTHEIAQRLGNDDFGRQNVVRRMKQIAIEKGYAVGSCRSAGYWLIETHVELNEVCLEYQNQIRGLQRTINKLRDNYMESRKV